MIASRVAVVSLMVSAVSSALRTTVCSTVCFFVYARCCGWWRKRDCFSPGIYIFPRTQTLSRSALRADLRFFLSPLIPKMLRPVLHGRESKVFLAHRPLPNPPFPLTPPLLYRNFFPSGPLCCRPEGFFRSFDGCGGKGVGRARCRRRHGGHG